MARADPDSMRRRGVSERCVYSESHERMTMIEHARVRRSEVRRVDRWIALGILLLICTTLTEVKNARAQNIVGEWTIPEDISAPYTEGRDLYGVLICDPNQNLHILWGKGHQDGSEIYYRTDAGGALSAPNSVLASSDSLALALSAAVTQRSSTLHLVWQNSFIKGDVFYSSAPLAQAGDARAWDMPRLMVSQADSAEISADNSGLLHLIYGASDAEGIQNSVYHVRSDDNGFTWSEPDLVYEVWSRAPAP